MKLKGFKREKYGEDGFRLTYFKRAFLTDDSADSYMVRSMEISAYSYGKDIIHEYQHEANLKIADCTRVIHLSFNFNKEGEKKLNNFVDKLIEFREDYKLAKEAIEEYNKGVEKGE